MGQSGNSFKKQADQKPLNKIGQSGKAYTKYANQKANHKTPIQNRPIRKLTKWAIYKTPIQYGQTKYLEKIGQPENS